jgi:hypothetical protein
MIDTVSASTLLSRLQQKTRALRAVAETSCGQIPRSNIHALASSGLALHPSFGFPQNSRFSPSSLLFSITASTTKHYLTADSIYQ